MKQLDLFGLVEHAPKPNTEKPFAEMTAAEMRDHTEGCRQALLALKPGDGASFGCDYQRPLRVVRIPGACSGRWFDVTRSITCSAPKFRHDMLFENMQRLRFSDALLRARSGYVPLYLAPSRPLRAKCPECGTMTTLSFDTRAFERCIPCGVEMCMMCVNECHARHEADPAYRRPLRPEQIATFEEEHRLVVDVVRSAAQTYVDTFARPREGA